MESPSNLYVSGKMEEMNCGWDVDVVSYMDISKLVESLGYSDFKSLYYRHPKLAFSRELRPLNCEADVVKFVEDVKGYEVIEVYVEHLLDTNCSRGTY